MQGEVNARYVHTQMAVVQRDVLCLVILMYLDFRPVLNPSKVGTLVLTKQASRGGLSFSVLLQNGGFRHGSFLDGKESCGRVLNPWRCIASGHSMFFLVPWLHSKGVVAAARFRSAAKELGKWSPEVRSQVGCSVRLGAGSRLQRGEKAVRGR